MLQPSSSPRVAFRDLKRARGIVDIFFLEEVFFIRLYFIIRFSLQVSETLLFRDELFIYYSVYKRM